MLTYYKCIWKLQNNESEKESRIPICNRDHKTKHQGQTKPR